jgi:hypothetical protein
VIYPDLLAQIGYWPDLFARREAPEADASDVYNGRHVGSLKRRRGVDHVHLERPAPGEIENGDSEFRIGI